MTKVTQVRDDNSLDLCGNSEMMRVKWILDIQRIQSQHNLLRLDSSLKENN